MNNGHSGRRRTNNLFAFLFILTQGPRARESDGVRWLPWRVESAGQGAPGLGLRPRSGNRAQGQRDQWPLLMHVLAVAKRPPQPPQLGPMLTQPWPQQQPWGSAKRGLRGQPAPTVRELRPAWEDGPGRIPVLRSQGTWPPAPRSLPGCSLWHWQLLRFEFHFCKGNDLCSCQASTLDSPLTLPEASRTQRAPLLHEDPAPAQPACTP